MDVAMERSRGGAGAEAGDAPDSAPTRPAQEGLQDPTAFSSGTKHPAVRVRLRDAQTPAVTAHHLGAASLVLCRHAESLPWRGVTGHGTVAADAVATWQGGGGTGAAFFTHSPPHLPPLLSLCLEGCRLLKERGSAHSVTER